MKVELKGVAGAQAPVAVEPLKDSAWAQATLLKGLGVPSDLLGDPRLTPDKSAIMAGIVAQMPGAERRKLREAAVGLKLSDYQSMERILPRNYERELIKIIDQLG
jgi:hypothetical protein